MAASSSEKQLVVIDIDDSEQSTYALNWVLDNFFPSLIFKIVLIHAMPSSTSVVGLGVGALGGAEMVHIVDSRSRKVADRVLQTAKQICTKNSVNEVKMEVVEGDPKNVLCEAVIKYGAAMLIVGCGGHGVIKRMVFGSVSDHCAHNANCTVMIVKKPQII